MAVSILFRRSTRSAGFHRVPAFKPFTLPNGQAVTWSSQPAVTVWRSSPKKLPEPTVWKTGLESFLKA